MNGPDSVDISTGLPGGAWKTHNRSHQRSSSHPGPPHMELPKLLKSSVPEGVSWPTPDIRGTSDGSHSKMKGGFERDPVKVTITGERHREISNDLEGFSHLKNAGIEFIHQQ